MTVIVAFWAVLLYFSFLNAIMALFTNRPMPNVAFYEEQDK